MDTRNTTRSRSNSRSSQNKSQDEGSPSSDKKTLMRSAINTIKKHKSFKKTKKSEKGTPPHEKNRKKPEDQDSSTSSSVPISPSGSTVSTDRSIGDDKPDNLKESDDMDRSREPLDDKMTDDQKPSTSEGREGKTKCHLGKNFIPYQGETHEVNWRIEASLSMQLNQLEKSGKQILNLALDFLDQPQPIKMRNVWRGILIGMLRRLNKNNLSWTATWRMKMKLDHPYDIERSNEKNIHMRCANNKGMSSSYGRLEIKISKTEADGDDYLEWFDEEHSNEFDWQKWNFFDLAKKFKIKYHLKADSEDPIFALN